MTEQINQVQPSADNGGSGMGMGLIVGIIIVILVVLVFLLFGRGGTAPEATDGGANNLDVTIEGDVPIDGAEGI